jgi:NADH-quinone oxidoreductase subunit N
VSLTFFDMVQGETGIVHDTMASLRPFAPELIISATIVVLLLIRIVYAGPKYNALYVMLAGAALAAASLGLSPVMEPSAPAAASVPLFTGMLVHDAFAVYMRGLILVFVALFALLTRLSGVPDREDATEFAVLVLGAVLGMCLMVSANHMLVVFLGVEMASVPSYVLVGLLRHRRQSAEAALKFAVFGAGAAGIMLYGISLLCGALGSAHIPTMAAQLADIVQNGSLPDQAMVLGLGALMVGVGLAFKLSAVPFHFWAPDVFEGASAEVAAFLSVASKAAALGLLVRVAVGLTASVAPHPGICWIVAGVIGLIASVTCTFGNLAAYGQTNVKRLLAYSTIAHAGYMLMPVAAAIALAGQGPDRSRAAADAVAAMAFYAGVYLFMNLAAFAFAAFLRNGLASEEIGDYAGLVRRSPGVALCFALVLFSLVGMPPLAGFAAKFAILLSLLSAERLGLVLLCVGAANTLLSLFYYLRIAKIMILNPEPPERPAFALPMASAAGLYCLAITAPIVVLGVWWNGLSVWASTAAQPLFVTH